MNKIYYFALTLIFVSCNYSIPNIQNGVSGNQVLNAVPIGSIPSYQTVATAIFTPKCLSCHSSGGGNAGGVNLETYASVTSHLAAVSSSITSGSMPKNSAPLTAREKEILLSWIDAGGPSECYLSFCQFNSGCDRDSTTDHSTYDNFNRSHAQRKYDRL